MAHNLKTKTKNRRKETSVVDKILISGLQNFEQYHKINPIDINIDDRQIISSLSKYGKYCLRITLLISASFNQTTNAMFITCNGLNDAKKALINGKIHNVLGVINLTDETNFALIKKVQGGFRSYLKKAIERQNTLVLR